MFPSQNKKQSTAGRNDLAHSLKQSAAGKNDLAHRKQSAAGRNDLMHSLSPGYHEVYPGTERMDYDFVLERRHVNGTNILESTSHLIKGCLGIGILCMHVGYMKGGLWASLGVTAVIGSLVPYIMYMLVTSAQKMYVRLRVPRLSYPHLLEAAVAAGPFRCCRKYSKVFRYTIDVILFTEVFGTCCIFQIMIADLAKQIIEPLSPTIKGWDLEPMIYTLIVAVPLLCVSIITNLKYLAHFSLIADFFIAICVVTAMYYSLLEAGDINDRAGYTDVFGLIQFTGIFLYSIAGINVTLPIENYMKEPQYFPMVIQIAMPLVILAVTLTGFFGYWGFGEKCISPITVHLPFETVPIILDFLLIAALVVSFAINFWVPFRIVWHYIGTKHRRLRGFWEIIYRVILVLLITGCSIAYPNLIKLMILIGNFFISITTFIFPAFIDTLVTWRSHKRGIRWRLIKNVLLILIGLVLCVGTILYFSLYWWE